MENTKIEGINSKSTETVAGTKPAVEVVGLKEENIELKKEIENLKKN